MKLDLQQPTIVLAGAWNPQIFQPGWILRHLYQIPAEENHDLQLVVSSDGSRRTIYFREVGITASTARIELFVNKPDDAVRDLGEAIGIRILEKLPHTPITAVGVNFRYVTETVPPGLQDKLATRDNLEEHYRVLSSEVVSSIQLGAERTLNFNRRLSDAGAVLDFNFHHAPVTNEGAIAVLRGAFAKYRGEAQTIMGKVYELEEDAVLNHDLTP